MTTQYYIQHKSGVFGVAILGTTTNIAVLWETGNKTLHSIPDGNITFHEAGHNCTQPTLRESLPAAKRLIEADYNLANIQHAT